MTRNYSPERETSERHGASFSTKFESKSVPFRPNYVFERDGRESF